MTDTVRTCPWTLLGVSPEDDAATIRSAWRALVRSYHPDLAKSDRVAANRKLAEINAAFDAICDHAAARRQVEATRRARAARQAEAARRAEAAQRAHAARDAEAARKAERAQRSRAARASTKAPGSCAQGWSRADRMAARAARLAFRRALRIFEASPVPRETAIYF